MNQPPTNPGSSHQGQQPDHGQPTHGQQPQDGQPEYPTQGSPEGGHQAGGPPASSTNKLLVVLVVVLFVGLVGLGAFVLLSNSSDTDAVVAAGDSSTTVPVSAATPDGKPVTTTTPVNATTPAGKPVATTTPIGTTTAPGTASTPTTAGATTVPTTAATPAAPLPCGTSPALFATGLIAGDPFVTAQLDPAGSTRQFDLVLDSGDVVQVDVLDLDFDPVVELFDSNGTSLGLNDDGPLGSASQLVTTTGVSGLHTVVVSAFDPTQCGLFEVAVTVVSVGPGTPLSPPFANNQFITLSATPELFNIDVVAGDSVVILVVDGSGTDPFITINDPAGAPFGSDDDGGSLTEGPRDALIEFVAPSSGRFAVFVESTNGVSGSAQLTILIN